MKYSTSFSFSDVTMSRGATNCEFVIRKINNNLETNSYVNVFKFYYACCLVITFEKTLIVEVSHDYT